MVAQWADSPFKLLETPKKKFNYTDHKTAPGAVMFATEMTLAHNMFIRPLNCIYLQAHQVKEEKDIADFTLFMHAWTVAVHEHHENEELHYFPWLENYIGIKDYMHKNVEQHHAFAPGLKNFVDYIEILKADTTKYDANKICSIIDDFGPILTQHLGEEIDTLIELQSFGDKIDWVAYNKRVTDFAVKTAETEYMIPLAVTNCDIHFEAPLHAATFPPWPFFVGWLFRFWYIPKHSGAWRFSSCDSRGVRKELEYLKAD